MIGQLLFSRNKKRGRSPRPAKRAGRWVGRHKAGRGGGESTPVVAVFWGFAGPGQKGKKKEGGNDAGTLQATGPPQGRDEKGKGKERGGLIIPHI